jgi:hypothetical protein
VRIASGRVPFTPLVHEFGHVGGQRQAAAVGQPAVDDALPAVVAQFAQRDRMRSVALLQTLLQPRLGPDPRFEHMAGPHRLAGQLVVRRARRQVFGMVLQAVAKAAVGHHQAVVAVVEHDAGIQLVQHGSLYLR